MRPSRRLIAVAALAVIGIAIALVVIRRNYDRSPPALESYALEATLHVEGRAQSRPGSDSTAASPDVIRAWYEAPNKWRREYGYSDPAKSDLTQVEVSDGQQIWHYDRRTNTYSRGE